MTTSTQRLNLVLAGSVASLLASCGGTGSSGTANADEGASAQMTLEEVSNGFGQLVPHTINRVDPSTGQPTNDVVSIRSQADLAANLIPGNGVLPVPKWPEAATLPSGQPGNQFMFARFTQDLDVDTVLDRNPGAQANSGLTGAVSVVAIDPITGSSLPVVGRAFVGGRTPAGDPSGTPPLLELQRWVSLNEFGETIPLVPEAAGFPGVLSPFDGSNLLVSKKTVVFIPDSDNNLSTYETFPVNAQIRMRVSTAVVAENGNPVPLTVLGCTTVGADLLGPEVITTPPPLNAPLITPGNGETNVDPLTRIRIEFTEPVQPLSVGDLNDGTPPGLSALVKLEFGPANSRTDMPFSVRPVSIFDFSVFELEPAFFFPGSGPVFQDCDTFAKVDITVNPGQLQDLALNPDPSGGPVPVPNTNLLGAITDFTTGEGPGIVNAPVAPDAIYAMRSGALPGVSVIDLNAFGAGTGNPTFSQDNPQFGNTNFPNNPNVVFQTGLRPPLAVGSCTIDGGGAGVFTLTRDSSLNDLVVRPPVVSNVSDLMIGHALDGSFNNAQFPFGCQAGGGELCTLNGLKIINPTPNGNGMQPTPANQTGSLTPGAENIISWAPHPNPPPLAFPPLCIAPFLGADEPSSIDNIMPQNPAIPPLFNLLGPGDPFGDPLGDPAVPPSGLLTPEQNVYFLGPSQGQTQLTGCQLYMIRQQVGHFLYVLDRQRGEILVLNSNRMTAIDRIQVSDPTSMAMGTNLDFLAVTNQQANTVTFIDIDPDSSTFHQIVKVTVVGDAPRGISWQPDNEDILVCNEGDDSLSLVSAFSLDVRKVVSSQLNGPFEVVSFPRQIQFAFNRQVYFAYILNRVGTAAMFESGPSGVNGWGFDDVIGIAPFEFKSPKTIQADTNDLFAGAWIVHEGPIDPFTGDPGQLGEGALSQLRIESAIPGAIPLNVNSAFTPQFRSMELSVSVSIGEQELSGVPVDVAFDNQRNWGGMINPQNTFSAGGPFGGIPLNGKNLIRPTTGGFTNNNTAQFAFAAVPNAAGGGGVVDVLQINAAGAPRRDVNKFIPGIQSIDVPNVTGVSDYWRQ
ncbi:MAG: beta-propeller fold lactonase family protein [bacterium]|nr:beta-propeller fold lactonase family protein [bacterium]